MRVGTRWSRSLIVAALAFAAIAGSAEAQDKRVGDYHYTHSIVDSPRNRNANMSYVFTMDTQRSGGSLAWKCMDDGNVHLYHRWATPLRPMTNVRVEVRYFIGDTPSGKRYVDVSRRDNYQSGFAEQGDMLYITSQAQNHSALTIEVKDAGGRMIRQTFSTRGLYDALALLPCARGINEGVAPIGNGN